MTEQEIHEQKQIEFYAAAVNAWLGTSLEHDRSLITLSAGGIGLLITLLSTVGLHSVESLILYIMALIAFTTCLTAVLWIFKRNRAHLEHAIHGDNTVTDPLLTVLDTVAIVSFLFGAVLAATIGVAAAVHSFETREMLMSQDKDRHMANDSINGILNVRPIDPLSKSFNGVTNMKPAPQQPASTPATPPAAPAPQPKETGGK
jgi:hypothetical protein